MSVFVGWGGGGCNGLRNTGIENQKFFFSFVSFFVPKPELFEQTEKLCATKGIE